MKTSSPSFFAYRIISCLLIIVNYAVDAFPQTADSDSLYAKGMTLFEEGKYKEAIGKFRQVWELDSVSVPDYMPAYESGKDWMAYAYLKSGNKAMAKELNPVCWDLPPYDRRNLGRISEYFQQYHEDVENRMWLLGDIHLNSALDEAERVFGKQSVIYIQSLIGLATLYLETNEPKKLSECIGKLDKLIPTLNVESPYLAAYLHLIKGFSYLNKGKYVDSLAEVRMCREALKGLEHHAFYEYGKMLNLLSMLVYYGDPAIFDSPLAALEELKGMVDYDINAFFSLPPHKQLSGTDLMTYSLEALSRFPNAEAKDYDEKIAEYIKILRGADREKYPYADDGISFALYVRALLNNSVANRTGKGFEKVWELAEEGIRLAEESPVIEKKNCLELMLIGANALASLQRYAEAEKIMDEVLPVAADKSNDRLYYLFDAVNGKSMLQQAHGRTDQAIETMRKYLPNVRQMKNQYPAEVGNLLLNYAGLISYDGRNIKEYTSVLKEAASCFETLDSPELQGGYLRSLLYLASRMGAVPEEREEALRKADVLIEKLKGNPLATPQNIAEQQANVLNARSAAARADGDLDQALEYNTEAIELTKNSGLAERSDLLNMRVAIFKDMNNFSEAMTSGEKLLALNRHIYGAENAATIQTMTEMIDIYGGNLRYDKAEEMVNEIERVLGNSWKSLAPESLAMTLISIGTFYNSIRDYDRALSVMEKGKDLMAKRNMDSSWEVSMIPLYLNAKSHTEHSGEVFEECKALVSAIDKNGYDRIQKFRILTSLAAVAKGLGEIGYAVEWFEKAYEDYGEIDDEIALWYLNTLTEYNEILNQLGRTDKSMEVMGKYFTMAGDLISGQGFMVDMVQSLGDLLEMAKTSDASTAYHRMEEIYKDLVRNYGETSMPAQNMKMSLIEIYPNMGHSMQETFEFGLPLLRKLREENKSAIPGLLMAMLSCAQYVDEPEETDLIMADIDKIPAHQLSPLDRIRLLSMKGTIALKRADAAAGLQFYREAFEKSQAFVLDNFLSMSAEERENFWNNAHQFFRTQIPQAAGIALGLGGSGFEPLVYDCALFTNSLLLSSDMTIAEAAASSRDKKVKKAYQEYEMYKQQLADAEKIYANGSIMTEDFGKRIEDLRTTLRKSERNLLNMLSDKLGKYNSHLAISSEDVRKVLGPTDVAIEFLEYPSVDNPQVNQYAAALLQGKEEVKLIPLFAIARDSDKWLECYDNEELFNVLWKPLEQHLQGATDIWFAPQGKLAVTAIESLPGLESLQLGNPFVLHRLTSTRQLALSKQSDRKPKSKDAEYVAYGGINYSHADDENTGSDKATRATPKKVTRSAANLAELFRGQNRDIVQEIYDLPGTEKEAKHIVDIVAQERKGKPVLLSGAKATESSFKNYSGRTPAMIHIGTHGFYSDESGHNSVMSPEEMAMQNSGLLFAGAQKGLFEPESIPLYADDGVLTASEISRLDLSGPELIVMSACETGLGKVSADGVFGLQRGFKKAGANALMMSLWKVDDEATTKLMETFYDGWLRHGLTKSLALQHAKDTLRSNPKWGNPRYWAAFILLDAVD